MSDRREKILPCVGLSPAGGDPCVRVGSCSFPIRELYKKGEGPWDCAGAMIRVTRTALGAGTGTFARYEVRVDGDMPIYRGDPGNQGISFHAACKKLQAGFAWFHVSVDPSAPNPEPTELANIEIHFEPYEPQWVDGVPLLCFVSLNTNGEPSLFYWYHCPGEDSGIQLGWQTLRGLAELADKRPVTLPGGVVISIDKLPALPNMDATWVRISPCAATRLYSVNPSGLGTANRETYRLANVKAFWGSAKEKGEYECFPFTRSSGH